MSDGTTQNTGGSTQGDPPTWFAGLDAEHLGHIQERGLDKLGPVDAAVKLAQMHRAARVSLGIPEDQLLKLPKEGDSDGWRQVWQRLGAPADAKEYAFEGIDIGGDSGATNSFIDALRATAAGLNMPKAMAAEMAKGVQKWMADRVASVDTEITANVKAGEDAIRASWGKDYETHNYVANRGEEAIAQRLGERLGPQLKDAMTVLKENGFGELGREMMRVIGHGLGEDKTASMLGNSGRTVMTREMAVARKAELAADAAWVTRYTSGDTDARKEMAQLNLIIVGE
jgi:hypothetical protein